MCAVACQWLFWLEWSLHEVEVARLQSERDALSVGLNFFDHDQKSAISPSECPELSARLFALLDVNRDGLISHTDLQQAVEQMMEEQEQRMERIMALEREVDELRQKHAGGHAQELLAVQMLQNEATMEELRKEMEERKRVLQSIFHYFHTAFALHVFGVTGRDLQARPVDGRILLQELQRVEREANENPLQVDESAAVFRREEHGQLTPRTPGRSGCTCWRSPDPVVCCT